MNQSITHSSSHRIDHRIYSKLIYFIAALLILLPVVVFGTRALRFFST